MRGILLTNDDGVDSPALPPFARALLSFGDVTVVVPDRQRSWIGKAITRSGEIVLADTVRDGVAVTTCSGYPADTTQLGVHVVSDPAPDVVVSGINLGANHGTAFMLSSGTVGAAVEGWLCGVRSIAFSTGVGGHRYRAWRRHAATPAAAQRWAELAEVCAHILTDVWTADLWEVADVISVNLPFDATERTPRRLTTVARVRYGQLFDEVGSRRYRHRFAAMNEPEAVDGTDIEAFNAGMVSITPVRMPDAPAVSERLRARIERRSGGSPDRREPS